MSLNLIGDYLLAVSSRKDLRASPNGGVENLKSLDGAECLQSSPELIANSILKIEYQHTSALMK